MTADLRAAALAARGTAYAAAEVYRAHARDCKDLCEHDVHWKCETGTALQATILKAANAAWEALQAYAPPGTTVRYHGSLTECHGPCTVEGVAGQALGSAYRLTIPEGRQLSAVRIESFTVIRDEQPQAGAR